MRRQIPLRMRWGTNERDTSFFATWRKSILGASIMIFATTNVTAAESNAEMEQRLGFIPDRAITVWTGQKRCYDWTLANRNPTHRSQFTIWLDGALTGYQAYAGDKWRMQPEVNEAVSYVDAYCSTHPLETIMNAFTFYILDFNRK
jgi:hypothetical protein